MSQYEPIPAHLWNKWHVFAVHEIVLYLPFTERIWNLEKKQKQKTNLDQDYTASTQQRPVLCLKAVFLCKDLQMLSKGKHRGTSPISVLSGFIKTVRLCSKGCWQGLKRWHTLCLPEVWPAIKIFNTCILLGECSAVNCQLLSPWIQVVSSGHVDLNNRTKKPTGCNSSFHISRSKIRDSLKIEFLLLKTQFNSKLKRIPREHTHRERKTKFTPCNWIPHQATPPSIITLNMLCLFPRDIPAEDWWLFEQESLLTHLCFLTQFELSKPPWHFS